MKLIKLLLLTSVVGLLVACQPNLSPDEYNYYGGTSGRVREGVIQDIQYNVRVRNNSGVGMVAGGVAGGAVGSNLAGGRGVGGLVGTIGGAVAGGLIGNAIEDNASSSQATLYIVRLQLSGHLISVIQESPLPLCKGDHVYVIGAGGRTRLKLNDSYYSSGLHSRSGCLSQ